MKPIRWGVLSTARIATEKVIPALQASELGEVAAIASRDRTRAESAARILSIPRAHGDYEALLADPEVDAVYIPLPNHMHLPWSRRALEAGKHVLCEKPIGLDADEARKLLAVAARCPDLRVMEAFMYRFHPQWRRAKALVDEGALGELRTIQTAFSYFNDDPENIRNRPETGGGALMDIGCYGVSLARFLFGEEPLRVLGHEERDPDFGVDRLASGVLEFPNGSATFTCATQLAPWQRVNVLGTRGRLEIEIPFNAPPDRSCGMSLQRDGAVEAIRIEPCDQYALQADAFARAVREGGPVPTPLADAVANMATIDALRRSSREACWVAPG